jgi:sugar-specific transcriptional regulator TrmB
LARITEWEKKMPFRSLRSIGFNDADIAVYELLVKDGESDRDELMKKSGLHRTQFEETLSKLQSYGAIEANKSTIAPVSPKVFLQKYQRRREVDQELQMVELRGKINGLQSLLEPVFAERRLGIRLEELWRIIDGLPAMEIETVKMISRSRSEVCILAEQFSWYPKVREELISALDRKVKVKVLLLIKKNGVEERVDEMKRLGIEVKQADSEWRPARFTIIDESELVFVVWARKSGESRIHYRPGYTKTPGLVGVFRDSFERLWEKAKKA